MWNLRLFENNSNSDKQEQLHESPTNTQTKQESQSMGEEMNFDMKRIGRNIAHYRKAKNMTQMNLADQMNISFQAVSNWERGQTMPDIAKLPELASILDCTIDLLLGDPRSSQVVKQVITEEPEAVDMTLYELSAVAPALEPERTERIFRERVKQTKPIDFTALIAMAPFLDEESLAEAVNEAIDQGTKIDVLSALAPFLSSESLSAICSKLLNAGNEIDDFIALAPFMEAGDLDRVVDAYLASGGDTQELIALAPFLNRQTLLKILRGRFF